MKTLDFLKVTFVLILGVNLFSCSDDNDPAKGGSEDTPENEVINQMSTDERLLVGKWKADGNPLFLYSDKSCITPDGHIGTYIFDPKTKELITTSGWGIRIVKSLDHTTMVLQGVQTTKVWTYRRQSDFVDKEYEKLLIGRWQNIENPEITIVFSSGKYILNSQEGEYTTKEGKDRIYINIDKGVYTPNIKYLDCYTLELSGEKQFKGTYKRVI